MKNEIKDLADSLNENKEDIPRARRVFNNLSKIESILKLGVTVKKLVYRLNENGFEIEFKQLDNDIYQARKKQKKLAETKTENTPKESENKKSVVAKENTQSEHKEKNPIKNMSVRAFKAMRDKEFEEQSRNELPPEAQSVLEKFNRRKEQKEEQERLKNTSTVSGKSENTLDNSISPEPEKKVEKKSFQPPKPDGFRLRDHKADNEKLMREVLTQPDDSILKKIEELKKQDAEEEERKRLKELEQNKAENQELENANK